MRTPREWRGGHIDGSDQHSRRRDPARAPASSPATAPIATICEGGYRSSLAASLLAHEGVAASVNVAGGMAAYRGTGDAHDTDELSGAVRERLDAVIHGETPRRAFPSSSRPS